MITISRVLAFPSDSPAFKIIWEHSYISALNMDRAAVFQWKQNIIIYLYRIFLPLKCFLVSHWFYLSQFIEPNRYQVIIIFVSGKFS